MTVKLILNVTATGSVDAIIATYDPAFTSLEDGKIYAFVASGANTSTTPTLNINSLGAKTIKKKGGQALAAGDIPGASAQIFVSYRATGTYFELVNPGNSGNGDVTGPGSSTNNAVALFDGTTGKIIKDSAKTLPSGAVVGNTDTQTLTNKTIDDDNNVIQNLVYTALKTVLANANQFIKYNASGVPEIVGYGSVANTVTEGNDSRLSDARHIKANFKQNSQVTHTGTVAETVVVTSSTAFINSTNISALDILRIMLSCGASSNANSKIIRIYANTTADLAGTPILLGTVTFTTGNNSTSGFVRHLNFISLTQQLIFPTATSNWSDAGNGTSGIAADPALDLSLNSYYLVVSCQLANSGDSARINYGFSEIHR